METTAPTPSTAAAAWHDLIDCLDAAGLLEGSVGLSIADHRDEDGGPGWLATLRSREGGRFNLLTPSTLVSADWDPADAVRHLLDSIENGIRL